MAQLEVKTVGDTTIYVNDSGRFFAEIDGKIVYRASKRSLERLIEQRLDPLRVIVPRQEWDWHVTEDMIIRATGDNLKGEESSYGRYGADVYVYNEEAMEKFKELLAEYQGLRNRWNAVLEGLVRVTPKNLEDVRAYLSPVDPPRAETVERRRDE